MKKIFLDANVIIDLLDKTSIHHNEAKEILKIIRKFYGKPYISPTTFAIAYYIFGKFFNQKKGLNKIIREIFSNFHYTNENHQMMQKVLTSDFSDYEDALQYYSAKDLSIDLIVTRNIHDYYLSDIPVLFPSEFIDMYYNS
jgi:predicted nucleic acid-binding protein